MKIYKEINLEWGMPIVSEAMKKLDSEIKVCEKEGIRYVKIIHGYGSTGKGGAIREECRDTLQKMLDDKKIKKIVYGEDFKILNRDAYDIRTKCADFEPLFHCTNKGVTIIEL
ncbi:MAG: Smr/MutS family protein [Lachnospiraceae bacterium]|nr:Smr/MutS family protein [Lachnospiraceae bacterium]